MHQVALAVVACDRGLVGPTSTAGYSLLTSGVTGRRGGDGGIAREVGGRAQTVVEVFFTQAVILLF